MSANTARPPLPVFYDDQVFQTQVAGGISRYFCALTRQFASGTRVCPILFAGITRNIYAHKLASAGESPVTYLRRHDHLRINSLVARLSRLWGRWEFLRARRRHGRVIYHPTYYDLDPFLVRRAAATVVTFYDLILERREVTDQSGTLAANPAIAQRRAAFLLADAVLAISAATKADLEQFYPPAPGKITITHLAAELDAARAAAVPAEPLPARFFLFVGNREGYKNGLAALGAFALLARSNPECSLVYFGGGRARTEEEGLIREHQLAGRVHFWSGEDDQLLLHYRAAVALIYPSAWEGFGLPILEAMELGCPVITARNSSLPEVGGDAVLYISPDNSKELAQQMELLLTNPARREQLVQAGLLQSRKFSWAATAARTADVYEELLARKIDSRDT